MLFASILIKIYYTNIILLKSIFIALCLKKFLTFQRKISFFPDWWYNGRGLSTKHRWYSENTNHHKRHFGNQFQNQGDLHSEYTHCLKIQKIFNWKIDSIFFFPQIIIGHGYKYDWCGWATLRTKEMAKMFWFSSSSDLCSFLSRIWSGILILYYSCMQAIVLNSGKGAIWRSCSLVWKKSNQMSMHSNGQKCHGILIVKMI